MQEFGLSCTTPYEVGSHSSIWALNTISDLLIVSSAELRRELQVKRSPEREQRLGEIRERIERLRFHQKAIRQEAEKCMQLT